ncbi:hypothetical protein [Streptomyces olivaceiscleroticus]|uniref:GAF domain-containing protein n=1 Tax=Streptomyces olivaceiscleroticus TaxID=68245 RepID=A0ABP3LHZ1_9ACTN
MNTLTAEQQARIDRDKARFQAEIQLLSPLTNAITTADKATRHTLVTDRIGALDLCNHMGALLQWRYIDAPLANLLGLAVRRAVRQMGHDPETIHIDNDLSLAEQDAWPLHHAMALYGHACYGPGLRFPADRTGQIGFLRLRSTADFTLGSVGLTAENQRLLVDAILATAADLEEVWS